MKNPEIYQFPTLHKINQRSSICERLDELVTRLETKLDRLIFANCITWGWIVVIGLPALRAFPVYQLQGVFQ